MLQHRYVNFPHHLDMFSSAVLEFSAQSGAGGTPWGPGAASAESCTHPAKRDRCFPPPIAERQRLPNVGIHSLAPRKFECNFKLVDFLIGHYTYKMFPPAIDIIPTLLVVVYSNGKYTN